jgi:hypothetical protein
VDRDLVVAVAFYAVKGWKGPGKVSAWHEYESGREGKRKRTTAVLDAGIGKAVVSTVLSSRQLGTGQLERSQGRIRKRCGRTEVQSSQVITADTRLEPRRRRPSMSAI